MALKTLLVDLGRPLEKTPGPLVVLSPHPDDETLACGGLVASYSRQGRDVCVVLVTDGSRSHDHGCPLTTGEVANARRRDFLAATDVLSGGRAEIVELGHTDLEAPHSGPAFDSGVARLVNVLERKNAKILIAPDIADAHVDHIAAAKMAHAAARQYDAPLVHLTYFTWSLLAARPAVLWRPIRHPVRYLELGQDRATKDRAISIYLESRLDGCSIPVCGDLPGALLKDLQGPREYFLAINR